MVTPFLGKGAGGMAHNCPIRERPALPFLGKGVGGMAVQRLP
jgi:hypothetical protein